MQPGLHDCGNITALLAAQFATAPGVEEPLRERQHVGCGECVTCSVCVCSVDLQGQGHEEQSVIGKTILRRQHRQRTGHKQHPGKLMGKTLRIIHLQGPEHNEGHHSEHCIRCLSMVLLSDIAILASIAHATKSV